MNVVKYTFIVLLLVAITPLYSQTIWLYGGGSVSFIPIYDGSITGSYAGMFPLPILGSGIEIQIDKNSSIETGLQLTRYGITTDTEVPYDLVGNIYYTKLSFAMKTWFIEMPFAIKLRSPISEKIDLVGMFGGYIGVGIKGWVYVSGYEPTTNLFIEQVQNMQWSWTEEEEAWNRLSLGHSLGISLQGENIRFGIIYQRSLHGIKFGRSGQFHSLALTLGVRIFHEEKEDVSNVK